MSVIFGPSKVLSLSPLFLAAGLAVFSIIAILLYRLSPKKVPKGLRPLPGPAGWPLIGNTLQLDTHPQKQLRQWAKECGEVYSINLGGYNWAMVNTAEAAKEIMDKQSASTSSRPPLPVLNGLVSGGLRMLMMEYTPKWRNARGVVHKLLMPKVSDTFKVCQEYEAKQMLFDLLTDNEDSAQFYTHSRRYTTSIMMTATYGKRVSSWYSKNIQEVYEVMNDMSVLAMPGTFLADMFPSLAKLPNWMQTWRKRVLEYHQKQRAIWWGLWSNLHDDIEHGKAPDCFVKQMQESVLEKQGISEIQGAFIGGTMIEAGSETTASSVNGGMKRLAANLKAQDKANKILTEVVGEDRTPTFEDEPNLQYIRAIVKEIFRIQPVASIGNAHFSTAEVIYKDYFIPKGSIVNLAIGVVNYDEDRYGDPYEFRPERFEDYNLRAGAYVAMADPTKRDHFGFGVGRRICPGMHLAENSVFIILAKILWAYEIHPPLVADGKEEELDLSDGAFEEGTIVVLKPFRLRFVLRSKHREAVIRREWEDAQRDGYVWGNVRVNKDGMISEV